MESWRLPGVNFTSEQLFFVGFGQVINQRANYLENVYVFTYYINLLTAPTIVPPTLKFDFKKQEFKSQQIVFFLAE